MFLEYLLNYYGNKAVFIGTRKLLVFIWLNMQCAMITCKLSNCKKVTAYSLHIIKTY